MHKKLNKIKIKNIFIRLKPYTFFIRITFITFYMHEFYMHIETEFWIKN